MTDRARRIFDILYDVCLDQCYCDEDHTCSYCRKLERARLILSETAVELHTIPDGEPCQPHELTRTQFVLHNQRVYVNAPGTRDLVDITDNSRIGVDYDDTVQPVRLTYATTKDEHHRGGPRPMTPTQGWTRVHCGLYRKVIGQHIYRLRYVAGMWWVSYEPVLEFGSEKLSEAKARAHAIEETMK